MVVDPIFVNLSLTSECTNPFNREATEALIALSLLLGTDQLLNQLH